MLLAPLTGLDSNQEDLMATITTAAGNGAAQEGNVAGRGIGIGTETVIGTAVRPAW